MARTTRYTAKLSAAAMRAANLALGAARPDRTSLSCTRAPGARIHDRGASHPRLSLEPERIGDGRIRALGPRALAPHVRHVRVRSFPDPVQYPQRCRAQCVAL